MTKYETFNLGVQCLTFIVLVWTLRKLYQYTQYTKQLAQAAVEEMSRPCVQVLEAPDQTEEAILEGYSASIAGSSIVFINIGTGPALNFWFQVQTSQPKPYSAAGPALPPNQTFSSNISRNALSDPATVVCEFETLSGAKYRTDTLIERRRWVKHTRFSSI